MDSIKEINSVIKTESESLLREMEAKLKEVSKSQSILVSDNVAAFDNTNDFSDWLSKRPKAYLTWGVIIGIIGLMKIATVEDDSLPFFGLILLVLAGWLIYNYSKKNSTLSIKDGNVELGNTNRKQLYIDTASSSIDDIQKKWKNLMNENKQKIQNIINNAVCSDDKKKDALDCTLMYENWDIDTSSLSDELDALADDVMFKIKADTAISHFIAYVAKNVRETVRKQIADYNDVEKFLNE